jgi:hypothetical protein
LVGETRRLCAGDEHGAVCPISSHWNPTPLIHPDRIVMIAPEK